MNTDTKQENFTITKHSFLDFYFNTGDDDSQESLRMNIADEIIDNLFQGNYTHTIDIQELFDGCGYIAMRYCEEVTKKHEYYDLEDTDLISEGKNIVITLIDDKPKN